MFAVAYTGVSTELNVTSESRGIENSTYLLSVVGYVGPSRCDPSLQSHTRRCGDILLWEENC